MRIYGLHGLDRDDSQWIDWFIDRCRNAGMDAFAMEEMRQHLRDRINTMRVEERQRKTEDRLNCDRRLHAKDQLIFRLQTEAQEREGGRWDGPR